MKTRAMKKVLSIICVLALLMSVCVVALVGITSAATTYTLNINGVNQTVDLEPGATLPTPEVPYEFLGWYDSLKFDNKVETAGGAKTLYAKFKTMVLNFDGDKPGIFDPNNSLGNPFKIKLENKALKWTVDGNNINIGIPTYANSGEQFKFENDVTYEISVRYKAEVDSSSFSSIYFRMYACDSEGVGQYGGDKITIGSGVHFSECDGEWHTGTMFFKFDASKVGNRAHIVMAFQAQNDGSVTPKGTVWYDDITITPVEEREYTFTNKGVSEKMTLYPGGSLPEIKGAAFEGWYDKTLTARYETVPASNTLLFAKYSKMKYTFDSTVEFYDPYNNFETNGMSIIDEDEGNKVLQMLVPSKSRKRFAFSGAFGAQAGYKIVKGQVYNISFRYKASGFYSVPNNIVFYASSKAGIGDSGDRTPIDDLQFKVENSDDWVTVEKQFVLDVDLSAGDNLLFSVYTYSVVGGAEKATFIMDDFTIAPYVPQVSADDVVMDFENDFKWSVADANNFDKGSGNGYVNRGEIVSEDNGNHYFKVKHFGARNANIYFTLDNGAIHPIIVKGGIYTIEFDYKVEHSETDSEIGLMFVKPTTGNSGYSYEKFYTVEKFTNRDDDKWTHVKYTFYATPSNKDRTSLGFYVFNSTNVPETNKDTGVLTATSVLFDNIVLSTHSNEGYDGLLTFDSLDGSKCTPIVGEGDAPIGVLPQPTKFGYKFKGWRYDLVGAGDSITVVDITETSLMPFGITEAYAVWELAEDAVELTFRANVPEFDDTTVPVVAYPGEPISNIPDDPTATSNKFLGWFYDTGFTKPFDPSCAPSESCTVYAKWSNEGTLVDFEKFPNNKVIGGASDRCSLLRLDDGNIVLCYDFFAGTGTSTTTLAGASLVDSKGNRVTVFEGIEYEITFKYKVVEAEVPGQIGSIISAFGNVWTNRQEQEGRMSYTKAENKWLKGSYTFKADYLDGTTSENNYLAMACTNKSKIYIDDIVIKSSYNSMNVYGSSIVFNTNGGKQLDAISGDPGDKLVLPTPVRAGYKFRGWYTDIGLTNPVTAKVFGDEQMVLHAKWQVGKFIEDFEDFPATVATMGVAGAYSFYSKSTDGFDASNIRNGETSLFRSGATAGVKNFTAMRSDDLKLSIGEKYTVTLYVKPTAIGDAAGTISLVEMGTYTGSAQGKLGDILAKVSDLKVGEWNEISYTFTAKSEFIGIATTAGNDMYFDDITVKLNGYTGSVAGATGDSSISPILVLALVVISAGALIITGKKVFSK